MFMKKIAENKAAAYAAQQVSEKKNQSEINAIKQGFHFRAFVKSVAK